jgi:predicted N-acetyltransferase YhbS
MIEFASEKYRKGIIELWQEAFGDKAEFINGFLDRMNYAENMLVYSENGEVCGMATMLPVFCGKNKGRYVYAVATAKNHRGKGICNRIMRAVDEFIVKQNEKFAILVPASDSLFGFYEKMGYAQIVCKPDFPKITERGKKCSVSEYFKIREKLFENCNLIGWSEESLDYILGFGETLRCENGAVYREGEVIKEALVPEIFDCKWEIPFGEIKYYDENMMFERPYFGLCMN